MLGFVRKNDTAKHRFPLRALFIPVHLLYALLLVLGIWNDNVGHCSEQTYPRIFAYQYSLFFLTYGLCVYLKKK